MDQLEAISTNLVQAKFHFSHNENLIVNLSESGNEDSNSNSEFNKSNDNDILLNNSTDDEYSDPLEVLKNIRQINPNRLVIAQLNINSLRNKIAPLTSMIKDNVDILLISETKIDSSFPTAQFYIDGFSIYRRDRNEHGGGLMLYVREDIPSSLLKTDSDSEIFYV